MLPIIYCIDTKDGRVVFYIYRGGKREPIKAKKADEMLEQGLATYSPRPI